EDELVKIWNKPKFVKNSNYVITLDRILSACHSERSEESLKLIEKILKHKNINEQIKEWQELGFVDENFKVDDVLQNDLTGKHLNKKYEHLPIDTKYFKDLELEILSLFDDLDNQLDGWLIKSENYQALNTILPKFKEKVQTIYIDPPFNLDSSDQFLYRTNYKDANWATLLENRLRLAREWLNEKGSIFVRCDYNGNWIVRCLMDEIFNRELINEIQINTTQKVFEGVHGYNIATNSLFWYGKNKDIYISPQRIKREDIYWLECHSGGERRPPERIFFGKTILPPKGRHWTFIQEKIDKMIEAGRIRINEEKEYIDMNGNLVKGMPEYQIAEEKLLTSNWTDIPGYTSTTGFPTENSEKLLNRVIKTTSENSDLILDFFLGSGTTTAVAHKLGRKWIGVEMGEHFYTVILPRMKKVLFYDKSGISKEVKEYQGGGFFKYYELEQYEETLANTVYENHDLIIIGDKSPYEQYVFMKDEKMLRTLEIDYENKKVKVDLSKLYENIDIAETLSNLTGNWIKKIKEDEVTFEDGSIVNTKDLDYKLVKPLIWWV
ncbi:MAG: site-specific DNA-methyltransferase, partial [Melioribacter sp.]|nr:site-specific DNA-methyltransferase [Melioribacter sp.]